MTTDFCCVYVDAGYLFSSVARRITNSSFRNAIRLEDKAALVSEIVDFAKNDSGMPLLRVLWYDGAQNGRPDSQQTQFASLPGVKARIGRMSPHSGEQKGVDVRIALDLVQHAVSGPVRCAYLISGDDDLTEAVDAAQEQGMIVKVLAIPGSGERPEPFAVSRNLRLTADDTLMFPPDRIDDLFGRRDPVAAAAAEAAAAQDQDTDPTTEKVEPESKTAAEPVAEVASTPVAAEAEPEVAAEEVSIGERPSPGLLPRRRIMPTVPAPISRPVYVSSVPEPTEVVQPLHEDSPTIERWKRRNVPEKTIDALTDTAASTATGFFLASTPAMIAEMMASRPEISREVDRVLMIDASIRLGVEYVDDHLRAGLRDLFWDALDKVRSSMGSSS